MVIRRVNAMSCAKVGGALYAGLGLLFAAGFSLFFLVLGGTFGMPDGIAATGAGGLGAASIGFGAAAIAAIVALPIFYGVIGAIGGLVTAFLYNLVAGFVGGIEIDVESRPGAAGL
jgi:hypothetical protein